MHFTNIIASGLGIASGLAAPRPMDSREVTQLSPREYWAFAFKQRDSNLAHDKRDKSQAVAARADMKFALKVREGSHAKRAPLDSQCEQTEEGIYCTYTSADVEAYGTAGRLQDGCLPVSTGVTCFYPGAKPEDIN